jgi:hypothetical protein
MSLKCNFAFCNERLPNIALLISNGVTFNVRISFWQAETENDDQNRWAGTEPEERAPAVRSGVDKASRKSSCQKITKSVALLQHAGNDSTCLLRAILESGCSSIAVQTTHCDTEQSSACKELLIVLAEACPQLENNEQEVVYDERPFSSVSIGCKTEDGGSNGPEHQNQSDSPGDLGIRLAEGLGEVRDCQADGEEVKGIPSL